MLNSVKVQWVYVVVSVIKLALFLMCYFYRRHGSSVAILMQDHRNDIVSNTVAIVCGYLGKLINCSGGHEKWAGNL